jgi:hypothetical protein
MNRTIPGPFNIPRLIYPRGMLTPLDVMTILKPPQPEPRDDRVEIRTLAVAPGYHAWRREKRRALDLGASVITKRAYREPIFRIGSSSVTEIPDDEEALPPASNMHKSTSKGL